MKEICRTTSLEEAQVFCSLLREHGIEPLLDGEYSGPVTLGLYTTATPLIVHVPDEHEAAALEILDALARERAGETVFERDPDAASSTPDEDARFAEQYRQSSSRSRRKYFWAGALVLTPVPVTLAWAVGQLISGRIEAGLAALALSFALGLPPLFIHLLARPARAKSPT